jgi:hypothetical protein
VRAMPQPAAPDWTTQAADTVEKVVGAVRDRTTVPLTTVARAVVYGLLAAFLGLATLVLVVVALVRAVDVYTGDGRVWIAHAALGGIFTLLGLLLLRKATASRKG